jgi:endonuclease/exonuclease/phosphatase family metal-dependent hydrolase
MRVLIWNMGNGGPRNSEAKHERAWRYLDEQDFDVALLQETRKPPAWADERWSAVWKPKYARNPSGRALWGCAAVGRSIELQEYEPEDAFPWLQELAGSTAIARTHTEPRWLASVHLHASQVPDKVLAVRSVEGVELTTPGGSVWEQNLIPHELRRLFAQETFIFGGDLNTDPRMDDKPWFLGGNRRLFEVYEESGFHDTRARFHDSYQPTYGDYQIDHVFADARTEQRVTGWEVDLRPATDQEPYSDHAPILVTLEAIE